MGSIFLFSLSVVWKLHQCYLVYYWSTKGLHYR
jgi:hypothetical protein